MDRASAPDTVGLGSITGQANQRLEKLVLTAFLFGIQESVKLLTCEVDRWAGDSLARRPKGSLAVSWPRQLGK